MNALKLYKRFRKALHDPLGKNIFIIALEYFRFKINHPGIAEQYFHKRLYRKTIKNPGDYVLTHSLEQKIWHFNNMDYFSITIVKNLFEAFFSKHDIPIVKSAAFNVNTLFFKGKELDQINNPKELLVFLTNLRKEKLLNDDIFIIKKKEHSWGGKDIYKINLHELKKDKDLLQFYFKKIIQSGFLFQNIIKQHPEIDEINPYSVNTIRIETFVDKDKNAHLLCARLRVSSNKNFMDNVSSGGIFVGIDLETGELHKEGYTDFSKYNATTYLQHPLTGFIFERFPVPYFSQVKELAAKAASLLPEAKVMGWDIAILPAGPVILEGNYFPGLQNAEIILGGFKNNKVFEAIVKEVQEDSR